MSVPQAPNTTCDVYRWTRQPPAAADVSGVKAGLYANYGDARTHVSVTVPFTLPPSDRWTHLLYVALGTDVRDGYDRGNVDQHGPDTVYVPDSSGTPFTVRFVERINRGLASDHLRVYLDRGVPPWPTTAL